MKINFQHFNRFTHPVIYENKKVLSILIDLDARYNMYKKPGPETVNLKN